MHIIIGILISGNGLIKKLAKCGNIGKCYRILDRKNFTEMEKDRIGIETTDCAWGTKSVWALI